MDNRAQFIENLQAMLDRRWNANEWTKFEHLSVYLRVSERMLAHSRVRCVQIANVSTSEPYQRKGSFTRMVEVIKSITSLPIYVENVHNYEFRDTLLRHGYVAARSLDGVVVDLILPRDREIQDTFTT